MKKRVLAAAMAALCFLCLLPAPARAAAVEITDVQGLLDMAKDPDGDYVLGADLDLAGVEWTPFLFRGTLDGAGHRLLNLAVHTTDGETWPTFDGNAIYYDTVFSGMFSVLNGATVKNLTLLGPDVEIRTEENCFVGLVAGFGVNARIENCTVEAGYAMLTQSAYQCGVGGLLGFAENAVITGCTAETTLVFVDTNREENCEEFLGGAFSCGYGSVTNCEIAVDGYASVHGYVHNGGLVGMYYDAEDSGITGTVEENRVTGRIRFFEDNYDRRAYCEGTIGETLGETTDRYNTTDGFVSDEVFEYETDLYPNPCMEPSDLTQEVAATCTEAGCTIHVCAGCGYTWRDTFTLPGHVPGEWTVVTEPGVGTEGLEQLPCALCGEVLEERSIPAHVEGDWMMVRAPGYDEEGMMCLYCAECGALLETESLPKLVRTERCEPGRSEYRLRYREETALDVTVLPEDAADRSVLYETSDPAVVTVSPEGMMTAAGPGTAVVSCSAGDGGAAGSCTVTVYYAWWQWIIRTVLFGFLWY